MLSDSIRTSPTSFVRSTDSDVLPATTIVQLPQLDVSAEPPPLRHRIVRPQVLQLLSNNGPPPRLQIRKPRVHDLRPVHQLVSEPADGDEDQPDHVAEEGVHARHVLADRVQPDVEAAHCEEYAACEEPDGRERPPDAFPGVDLLEQRVGLGLERGAEAPRGDGAERPDHEEGGRGDGDEPGVHYHAACWEELASSSMGT